MNPKIAEAATRGRERTMRKRHGPAAMLLAALLAGAGAASAQPAAPPPSSNSPVPLRLELNRLEADGQNCRVYLLADNSKGEAYRSFKVDLFVLDSEGVAAKRVVLELGPIAAAKTMIRLFDIQGVACSRFGRVLLNDVLACEGESGTRQGCLADTRTESKTSAPFAK
jgi:hypothetical protein